MPSLEDLLLQLEAADKKKDTVALRKVREEIVSAYPDANEAAEALYKLGLDLLFRERKLELATEKFQAAAKKKTRLLVIGCAHFFRAVLLPAKPLSKSHF